MQSQNCIMIKDNYICGKCTTKQLYHKQISVTYLKITYLNAPVVRIYILALLGIAVVPINSFSVTLESVIAAPIDGTKLWKLIYEIIVFLQYDE